MTHTNIERNTSTLTYANPPTPPGGWPVFDAVAAELEWKRVEQERKRQVAHEMATEDRFPLIFAANAGEFAGNDGFKKLCTLSEQDLERADRLEAQLRAEKYG